MSLACAPCLALLAGYGKPKSSMGDCGCGCGGGKKKLSGMGEWGPTPGLTLFPPIQTGRGHAWKQGMAGFRGMAGIGGLGSGLGELSVSETTEILYGMVDGSIARDLVAQRNILNDQLTESQEIFNKASAMPDDDVRKTQAINSAQYARDYTLAARRSYDEAKAKYDKIAGMIQTYTYGAVTPAQLGSLGLAPIAALVVVAGSFVAVCTGLAVLIDSMKSNGSAARGYLDQAASLVGSVGDTAVDVSNSALKMAGIAALAIGGYFFLKSKRMI